jgi:hypothetical protein
VQPPDDAADLIEQPGLVPSRGQILMSVHSVFPYGGARLPLYNPHRLQGLASLADAPPRYNRDIIRRRPSRPQPPTVPQPIRGRVRDEADAKCLTRRPLHFASEPADGSASHFMLGANTGFAVKLILFPFMVLAALGLFLSIFAHAAALAGITTPGGQLVWGRIPGYLSSGCRPC